LYEPLFTLAGHNILFSHLAFALAAGVLIFNTLYFCYDNDFFDIPDIWYDAWDRVADFFATTFIYRCLSGEEAFWDTNGFYHGTRYSNYYNATTDFVNNKNNVQNTDVQIASEGANNVYNADDTNNTIHSYISEEERKKEACRKELGNAAKLEFEEYMQVFGDCMEFDEVTARYKQLCEKYYPNQENGQSDVEKFQHLQRVYEIAKSFWGESDI
jgi:hypothetical protein